MRPSLREECKSAGDRIIEEVEEWPKVLGKSSLARREWSFGAAGWNRRLSGRALGRFRGVAFLGTSLLACPGSESAFASWCWGAWATC